MAGLRRPCPPTLDSGFRRNDGVLTGVTVVLQRSRRVRGDTTLSSAAAVTPCCRFPLRCANGMMVNFSGVSVFYGAFSEVDSVPKLIPDFACSREMLLFDSGCLVLPRQIVQHDHLRKPVNPTGIFRI